VEVRYEPTESSPKSRSTPNPMQRSHRHRCSNQVRQSGDKGSIFAFGQKHDVYHSEINEFSSNRELSKRGILASASEGVLHSECGVSFPLLPGCCRISKRMLA